jgi:hypothetical protein
MTPYASELLDRLIGSSTSRRMISFPQVADQIIWRMAREGGLAFEEDRFSRALQSLDADLRLRQLSLVSLVPLLGMTADSIPIALGPDLEIDRMTDEEIARCLRLGMLPGAPFDHPRMRTNPPAFAIRLRYEEPLCIGDLSPEDTQTAFTNHTARRNRLVAVLAALRVFKAGRVSIPGILNLGKDWITKDFFGFTFENPGFMPWSNQYGLAASETAEFQAFWKKAEAVTSHGPLANAVRRFSYANERERPDDALVDYMIAAESLFLSDVNQQDRGEMRFRLSQRAALFVDPQATTACAWAGYDRR